MEKTVSASTIAKGQTGSYTITISNNGAIGESAATGVVLTDILPTGIQYNSHTVVYNKLGTHSFVDGSAGTVTESSGTIILEGGKIHLGDNIEITVNFNVGNSAIVGATIINDIASGALNMAQIDGDLTNNTSSAQFIVDPEEVDLKITKTVNDETPDIGDSITFSLLIENKGPSKAVDVSVTDIVPAGFTYVPGTMTGLSPAASGISADESSPTGTGLAWTIGSLIATSNTILTFQEVVNAP